MRLNVWGRTLRLVVPLLTETVFGMNATFADESTKTIVTETLSKAGEAKIGFGAGSIIVAPIPLKNPALGNGLILTGGYLFKFDEGSDTSFIGAAAMKTDNGSLGVGAAANLNFGNGRWSVQSMFGKANVNYAIYGIGDLRFPPFALSQDGAFAKVKLSRGLTEHLFVGIDAQYLDTTIQPNGGGTISLPNLPGFGIGARQVVAGPDVTWDSRDDTIYPTTGLFGSLTIQHGAGLGIFDNEFNRGVMSGKAFLAVGGRGVLAVSATACSASKKAPFFNLCAVGVTDTLRGYSAGEHIDNALVSVQGEFRYRLSQRLGAALFAGASVVGSDLGDLGRSGSLYAGGLGLRYRLSKSYPLDFSVDATVNRDGVRYTYIYIGQAF